MNTNGIVSEIDAEITRLQQAKAILTGTDTAIKWKPGRPARNPSFSKTTSSNAEKLSGNSKPVRTLSVEARAKIADAQRSRWAKSKKAAKKNARKAAQALADKKPR